MNLKWIGAVLIIAGCGGFGFALAFSYRREIQLIAHLIEVLDFMNSELEYRRTPLPELCKLAVNRKSGCIAEVFSSLSSELNSQIAPDAASCMKAVLGKHPELPKTASALLSQLGQSLGLFGLEGQIAGLRSVKQRCQMQLQQMQENRVHRMRSYQTLGLCAGAALAILLL